MPSMCCSGDAIMLLHSSVLPSGTCNVDMYTADSTRGGSKILQGRVSNPSERGTEACKVERQGGKGVGSLVPR